MNRFGDCETCKRQDRRYCVGCQPMMRGDGSFSRTLWTPKPEMVITFTTQIDDQKHITEKGMTNAEL